MKKPNEYLGNFDMDMSIIPKKISILILGMGMNAIPIPILTDSKPRFKPEP